MKSDIFEVKKLLVPATAFVARADSKLDGKTVFMALNGLQGMSTDDSHTVQLLVALNSALERGEKRGFKGFDDFHQLAGALSGLCRLNSKVPVVKQLVDILSRLVKIKHMVPVKSNKSSAAGLLQKNSASRVGMALFGLQGFQRHPDIDLILAELIPYINALDSLDGKALGMALQMFKSCPRQLSVVQEQILGSICRKMSGWSMRGKNKFPISNSKASDAQFLKLSMNFLSEGQVTLRSSLVGVQKLNVKTPVVKEVLLQLASEVCSWKPLVDRAHTLLTNKQQNSTGSTYHKVIFEARTVKLLQEVYSANDDLKKESSVLSMLELLKTSSTPAPLPHIAASTVSTVS